MRQLEVRGPERELREAVKDAHGHAYSLLLLGSYLRDATDDHEIRRRHEIPLLDQDAAKHRYHARHLFGAYVQHLSESSPEVAVLRLLGFFDRPAEEKLLAVLREAAEPKLNALTASLRNLSPADWRRVLRRLTELRLVDVPGSPSPPIDSHPHGAGRCSAPSGSSRRVAASIRGCRDPTSRESAGVSPALLVAGLPILRSLAVRRRTRGMATLS